jgi:hypothetical protein
LFNQMTPSDIVGAIGITARDAARSDDPAGDFARDQLLSAYSATRHLAVELSSYEPELSRFRTAAASRIRAAAADDPDLEPVAGELEADDDVAVLGAALADLLKRLRDDETPSAARLRSELRALLRELADREVDLLADALS